MVDFIFQQTVILEIEVVFPTYSLQLDSIQSILSPYPLSTLFFQRFVNLNEYNCFNYLNLQDKVAAQIVVPDEETQTDMQKIFFSCLSQIIDCNVVVAETIDESAEFIYVIFNQNINPGYYKIYDSQVLTVFKFSYSELWNVTINAFAYIRNLQISNNWLAKQCLELGPCYEFFSQNISYWNTLASNSDSQLKKLSIETKKKKKKIRNINLKIEVPSLDCLLCCTHPKSIVFLPCGHLVACKVCTTQYLKIELGKILNQRRTPRACPVCKQPIKEAREVFI
jgi:Zinc finger, C3HC4 type (RING finger)